MKELTQDFKQRIMVGVNCIIEFYRVITSSLIILFVPQKCETPAPAHVCSLKENLEWTYPLYNVTLVFNFLTLFSFFLMYYCELRREYLLIKYLDVNEKIPNDNQSVSNIIEMLPEGKEKILKSDKWYSRTGYFATIVFVVNSFVSGFCLYNFYLNNQTTTTFITYLLFMILKIVGVWNVINTEDFVFYSSYLRINVQYNDIDSKFQKNSI
jgi:hypothetical protein